MDEELVSRAAARSVVAHAGQRRDDGADYATHPHAVAELLRKRGVSDAATLAAAYLHDVLEDTDTGEAALRDEFGDDVVGLVLELTCKPPQGTPFEERQALLVEHCRHMSPRAKVVKLADRLHNLSGMGLWPQWKQQRYARAALELLEALLPWPDHELAIRVRALSESALAEPQG